MVAWFVKASVFNSLNSAPSANGGSNPACGNNLYMDEFIKFKLIIVVPLYMIALDCDIDHRR